MWELKIIQEEFMRHFGVDRPEDLQVPEGDYLVPVYDEYFGVRIKGGNLWLVHPDKLDNPTRIPPRR